MEDNKKSMVQLAYEFLTALPQEERIPRKIKTFNKSNSELWVMLEEMWPEKFEKTELRKTPWATLDAQIRQDERFVIKGGWVYLKEWGEIRLPEVEPDESEDALSISEPKLQERFYAAWKSTKLKAFGFGELKLVDSEQENKNGHYNTGEVGEIDLLFLDSSDDYIVVELKRKEDDKVIGQLLRYMGWVKKNLCKYNQDVKGIIITREITPRLLYAGEVLNKLNIKIYPWFEK